MHKIAYNYFLGCWPDLLQKLILVFAFSKGKYQNQWPFRPPIRFSKFGQIGVAMHT